MSLKWKHLALAHSSLVRHVGRAGGGVDQP